MGFGKEIGLMGVETNDVKSPEATCDVVGKSARCIINLMLIKNFCQDINHCVFHIPDELLFHQNSLCDLETPQCF